VPQDNPELPWITEIKSVFNLHETRDYAKLSEWMKSDGKTVGNIKDIPWCGDAVQTAFALSLPKEPLPENPWAAISWSKWGRGVAPQYGCVLSFWRGDPKGWQGHVGFYVGEDAKNFYVLGGNQSDSVSVTKIAKNRLRENGSRWPMSGPNPTGRTVQMSTAGAVSVNEA
jgi:uncharacterized protein (TIGR02594 family)